MLLLPMQRFLFLLFLLAFGCRSSRPLQPPLSPAVFHPDGTAIVFSVARGKTCFLYKADIATGTMQRITARPRACGAGVFESRACWGFRLKFIALTHTVVERTVIS